ncbi:MAG: hypothetical protein KJ798_11625 [Gammaproteobacteria bacterium]|nr:hypothetical protein [Gammaproteobacteria bacterium]MBU0850009.1 hypothetical protein [Gammaproteobacteria bacterium]MBU1268497.1 hypothetical protein [Gammaproteobacteria bacterium]MBU1528045.1 hypothetical protein [Gammaproteobacteria bacterium]MBU1781018.1 hypothetical protein [Gammaproteobacteria bacterium]
MKAYVFLVVSCSVIVILSFRLLELSWTLSLIGGLLATSGMAIFLFGCNVQRLLANQEERASGRSIPGWFAKFKSSRK